MTNGSGAVHTLQRPNTTRTRTIAEGTLREMLAHCNVMDASIELVAGGTDLETALAARDLLDRLDSLTYASARLGIADLPRVTDALEAVILTMQVRRSPECPETVATIRHGIDVLMLLTHDGVRRLQGHPAAELMAAVDAFFERVDRLLNRTAPAPVSAVPARL